MKIYSGKNSTERWLASALLTGGILVTIIGIAHIFMPSIGYERKISLNMPEEISDHFYFLGTYAICMFLLSSGFISMYASRMDHPNVSFMICIVFGLFWTGRMILEIIYPVKVKLFFLDTPTTVLQPVITFIALTYISGVFTFYYSKRQ